MNCDPIRGMARIATSTSPKVSMELKGRMNAELAKYVHPQLRSVEHKGVGPGGVIEVSHTVSARELIADRITRLASRAAKSGDS